MKKALCLSILAMLPMAANAESETYGNYTEPLIPMNEFTQPTQYDPDDIRFFVEYGITFYAKSSAKLKAENIKIDDTDISVFNGLGSLRIGLDYKFIQLGFSPMFEEQEISTLYSFLFNLDIAISDDSLQPFVSLVGGWNTIKLDDYDISETALKYGFGGGIKYNINDNLYAKFGVSYMLSDFDTDIESIKVKMETSGLSVYTSLGYRF